MIFQPHMARLITRGIKTQTRRPLQRAPKSDWIVRRDGSRRRRPQSKVIQVDGELYRACRYRAGQTYSVQPGRGKRGEHRILVTNVRRERLDDITYQDARAEGTRTTDDYRQEWVRIHDKAWVEREKIDLADVFGDQVVPWILLERFRQRHADTLVWVITFQLVLDVPRLLAPAGDAAGDDDESGARAPVPGGYTVQTSRALFDPQIGIDGDGYRRPVTEPEPVDEAALARFAADAAERGAGDPGRRLEDLRQQARSLARRLRQEADAGAKSGLDVSADLQRIEEHLRILEEANEDAA